MIQKYLSYYVQKARKIADTTTTQDDPSKKQQRLAFDAVLGLILLVATILIESLFIMLLFNAVVPHLAQSKAMRINFGQALALKLLIGFLF
jgi:hypothetical protein